MLNKALLASQNELNEFTEALVLKCQSNGYGKITTRHGMRFEVYFCDVNEDGNEHPFFYTADWHYGWNADGSSIINRSLDMVEF